MTKLNARYALEDNGEKSFRIVDLFKQAVIGDFWFAPSGAWAFHLEDGRSRFGGYRPVLKSLRLMLPAA